MGLEEAIRRATAVPAPDVFGLPDRGVIRPGAYADIVVFDWDRLREGDDLDPTRPPEGICQVMVNGVIAYENGIHTGVRAGKVLRRNAS